ncbi:lysophospholipid acyltransferase family protein [Thermodesulfobacteriota bacterium]
MNIFIYRNLGWRLAFFYLTNLMGLFFFFKRREKWQIRKALESVFNMGIAKAELRKLIRKVFRGLVFHYYEKLFNAFSTGQVLRAFFESHVKGEGLAEIDRALARGKGALLITGHYGGVEFIPGFLAFCNYPVSIVAKFSSNHLRKVSKQKAKEFGTRIIDADQTPNVMRAIFNDLKKNRIVITMCDEIEEWRPSRRDRTSFLGKPICLDRTIEILLRRGDAAVVFGIMHRRENQKYRFIVNSLEEIAAELKRLGKLSLGEVVLKHMEQFIYKHPEEWYQWKKALELQAVPIVANSLEMPVPRLMVETAYQKAA